MSLLFLKIREVQPAVTMPVKVFFAFFLCALGESASAAEFGPAKGFKKIFAARIATLAVLPKYRNQGVAEALAETVTHLAGLVLRHAGASSRRKGGGGVRGRRPSYQPTIPGDRKLTEYITPFNFPYSCSALCVLRFRFT